MLKWTEIVDGTPKDTGSFPILTLTWLVFFGKLSAGRPSLLVPCAKSKFWSSHSWTPLTFPPNNPCFLHFYIPYCIGHWWNKIATIITLAALNSKTGPEPLDCHLEAQPTFDLLEHIKEDLQIKNNYLFLTTQVMQSKIWENADKHKEKKQHKLFIISPRDHHSLHHSSLSRAFKIIVCSFKY